MLHGHGDDRYKYDKEIVADFSTNVWYGGEPAGLKEHVFEHWEKINRYPEVIGESLRVKIANHEQLPAEQILVSSGTTESIYLIAQLFAGKRTTIVTPAFSEYEDACNMYDHQLSFLSWQEALEQPRLKSDLVFICSPNNPTGKTFPDLEFWMRLNRQCVFVIDEAFIDFTLTASSYISLIEQFSNLIIMRSLTKAYAIPGLRLGFMAGHSDMMERLISIKQPWTVNTIALAAGEFIYDHYEKNQLPLQQLLADKIDFVEKLKLNEVIQIEESETHFFLAKTLIRNAAQLKLFLIENHGILIRDASNFRNLTRQHFRLATLSPDKNQLLINALEEWKKLYY
ncbi:aminotransferase class I/II-fold pyridoxal phosphate-dependent enzyme [Dyadobacter sp. CY312]|uniref:aminotransferase class I/II-fold pyridoxal phosphate-dependent enzyme n=1 Tax=Dyadobacter sp. CY312 TaxID=2907303 RepID=UPI001F345629|nr:aminotransferase class I/II-fold pyridoxal phosphate-dependent enzyme [Dyadobacter sp. CY312]MCE7040845.1 aminotransferase class I/II-fold pyridoxal phosphate-dependent enzyme [Dyadobacter sp. CY312]